MSLSLYHEVAPSDAKLKFVQESPGNLSSRRHAKRAGFVVMKFV